jgi:glycosyltransferase involved in cell wall biosynthesis
MKSPSPRILFLIDSLGSGGAQRQILLVLQELLARDSDAWLMYYRPQHHYLPMLPPEVVRRIRYVPLTQRPELPGSLLRLRRAIAAVAPDVLVALPRGAATLAGLLRASGLPFRWIISERDTHIFEQPRLRQLAYRAALRTADVVVPNSETAGEEIRGFGVPAPRVVYIGNGIDLPQQPPTFARAPGPTRLLMVGRLVDAKNPLAVLRALERVQGEWRLDHFGRNQDEPDILAKWCEIVASRGWEDRVTLHGATLDMTPHYQNAHLLVHPSHHEGFPNVVLEAWVCGCPVLVSDRGDLPKLVEHDRTGLVAALERPEDLVTGLQRAVDDPSSLERLAVAGWAQVQADHAIRAVADRWQSAFDLALGAR